MPYDARWLQHLPIEAEVAAMRLRGLSYLTAAWGAYHHAVGDPGPVGEDDVMATLGWALDAIAETLTPPEADAIPNTPGELLGDGR